ncbi:MAG: response regulator, partial [Lachnospiraceae bacterium]|nr:response regulator [Lachnospiraceae bacterium]
TIKGWLEGKYQVYVADGGMSGISLLARHSVDLILLDYEMPIVTGAKVLELIRSEAETADIPVIFLTSKSDKDTVMSVMALKPVKYLLKTSPREDIVKEIDDFFMKEAAKKVYIKK